MEGKVTWTVGDAVDYKGFPIDKSTTGGWIRAAQILVIEICERLTTMGVAVNLVTYLTGTMHLHSAASANIVTDFMGTSFLLCLLGGFLADSFLGRYMTIAIFAAVQAVGVGVLAISTALPQLRPPPCDLTTPEKCNQPNGLQIGVFYLSLYLLALGIGGLKSSVSGFGTDQFDGKDEKERIQMTLFFGRFFFFVSTGTLLAVTVLVYIQDEVGRTWAYAICSISTLLALFLFLSGTRRYRYKRSVGSPVVQILRVIAAALRKRKLQLPSTVSFLYEDSAGALRISHTDQFRFLDRAAIVTDEDNENISTTRNPWKLCSVTKVEEVKMMIRLLPIWATTIMFWTAYAQMITFSVEQASTMERSIGSFLIPAGSLTVFFVGAILITLAIYDRIIIPIRKRWKGQHGFTHLQRISIGLFLSTLGMASAAIAEVKRLSVAGRVGAATGKSTLPVSVFLLIPQFFLVGSGEAFIYTGQLDFFITQSPKGMKTMSTGLFLTTLSLGFFVSSFLVSVVKNVTGKDGEGWLASNINKGRLDLFYALLAALSFINMGFFLLCAARYKQQRSDDDVEMEDVTKGPGEERC